MRVAIENKNDYVDLGLPSGTLWATKNIGANSSIESGDYFAWGETKGYKSGKKEFSWNTYKWSKGDKNKLTKYCDKSRFGNNGFTDNKIELNLEDDAANVNWGINWRMPSIEQLNELREKCTWKWVTYKGTSGYVVKGSNGKSIFLPATGLLDEVTFKHTNSGCYWSRTLYTNSPGNPEHPEYARRLDFTSDAVRYAFASRDAGLSVRPVRITQKEAEQIAAREEAERKAQEQAKREKEDREGVDLGLPSGTLWATRNVGANSPEDYGDYFAWGETQGYNSGKRDFSWSTYKWCNGSSSSMTKYCDKGSYGNKGFTDNKNELDLEDDAAYVNWGSQWRMPSKEQQDELREKCTWTWTTCKGTKGYLVKGKNGNSIFLPAAGWCDGTSLGNADSNGVYWSRSLYTSIPNGACYLYFYSGDVGWSGGNRYCGQSVRPVRQK